MNRSNLIVLSVLVCGVVIAQPEPPDSLWSRTFGGSGSERAWSVRQTTDGGYVVLGDSNVFAPEGSACHFWLVKTDEDGNAQWSRDYGGNYFEYARCVQQTADGGYILVGRTYSFGAGNGDCWLVKTNATGDSVWSRTYGGPGYDAAYSVQQTFDGGYVLAGYTNSFGAPSNYLIKTDTSGHIQWYRTFAFGKANSVQQTADSGYIMAGPTQSSGANQIDFYLLKTDGNGDSLWARVYGGNGDDYAFSVQQTADGGYIVAGHEDYWGNSNGYVVKTDSNGDTLWTHRLDGGSGDFAFSVCQTNDGNFAMAGWTASYGSGEYDIYIERIDSVGGNIWTATWGGSGDDRAYSLQPTSDGGYVVAGFTDSYGAGGTDFWLVKTGPELGIETTPRFFPTSFRLGVYPNPFNAVMTVEFALPKRARVMIRACDVLGRDEGILADDVFAAGQHSVNWQCADCASGVYFITMSGEGIHLVRKAVLLR